MAVEVSAVFAAYFARNRGPSANNPAAREPPFYVVSAQFDGSVIDLSLTFCAGKAYCCYEWGCHSTLIAGKRWDWLRRELEARNLKVSGRLELRLTVMIEHGALFFEYSRPLPQSRFVYELSPSGPVQYGQVISEADSPIAEPGAAADRGNDAGLPGV